MPAITEIYWANVPSDVAPAWASASGRLMAVWPSPIDDDACFAAAGFTRFADTDGHWDSEWKHIVGALLEVLRRFGEMRLLNRDDVFVGEHRRKGWLARRRSVMEPETLSPLDRLVLSTQDDQFPDAVVTFGDVPKVTVRCGRGHPILWIALDSMAAEIDDDILKFVADGRPVVRCDLKWAHLVP